MLYHKKGPIVTLQCSFLFIIQEIIIFMTSCKLVIGIYKGLYLACIMQTYGCPLLYGAFLAMQGFLETSQAPTIVYSTVQLASYLELQVVS